MATQTSVNNEFRNNVTVSESGTNEVSFTINNDSNTAGSNSKMIISTGGASAGDPFMHFYNNVVNTTIGIDNSDSDALVFSNNAAPGTTNVAHCNTDGEWTYPLQPAFRCYSTSTQSNVTGASQTWAVNTSSELFDQSSSYLPVTLKFTAPIDGIYLFVGSVDVADCTQSTGIVTQLVVTTGTDYFFRSNRNSSSRAAMATGSVHMELDASDTVQLAVTGYGEAGNTNDIYPGANATHMEGVLIQ